MTFIQSIILGIVQGLTEFIPVSSTAHLLIVERLMGLNTPDVQASVFIFDVLVQMGTLLALIVYFWSDLLAIIRAVLTALWRRHPFGDLQARLGWYLLLASIPALAAGLVFSNLVEKIFSTPALAAAIRLLTTAVLLVIAERFGKRSRQIESVDWKDALWIGLAQVLSVFPGASRSGSTIAGGMTRHLDRPSAARFAFLLAVPVMLAAGGYETFKLFKSPQMVTSILPQIIVGFVVAAIVGYFAIRWLLKYLTRRPLYDFAIYCTALGLITLVYYLVAR
jgi:undecaprenyl-diphosphatase